MTVLTDHRPNDTVLALSFGHVAARALHVVAELGVADHLDRPRDVDSLAADLQVDADALQRLLRLLETHGLFARDAGDRWSHTPSSRLLRTDHPVSMRAFARMAGTPFGWSSFTGLDHTVVSGEPGIRRLEPAGWTTYLRTHPEEAAIFQQAMTAKAHEDVAAVLACYDFSAHHRVVDVAGGRGHLLRAVLAAHPTTSGVLFELPDVASEVPETDRFQVVAGDFFADGLPEGDVYLLMNIVHDWDDLAAARILSAVADAGRARGAAVLLIEALLPEDGSPHWAATLDVMMLAMTGGRERTLSQYSALLADAGLELVSSRPTSTAFTVIEARCQDLRGASRRAPGLRSGRAGGRARRR